MDNLLEEFKEIVGEREFKIFLTFLTKIGPSARTHRISVVIASIMQYAVEILPAHCGEVDSLDQALIEMVSDPYHTDEDTEAYNMVFGFIESLCKEAGMTKDRESARGESYSIAENVISEFTSWYNMPWEDY